MLPKELEKILKLGWRIFPIKAGCKNPPLVKWKEKSSNDPKQIEKWLERWPGCNWGLDCGASGVAVIDEDVKKQGDQTLLGLEMEHGELPETLTARTQGGGRHLYYIGIYKSGTDKLGTGVDVKSVGGYVVLPPSKTPDGEYTWLSEKEVSKLPPEWVSLMEPDVEIRPEQKEAPAVDLDIPSSIMRAIKYLMTAEPSVEGMHGDINAFRVAGNVKDLGISSDTCLSLMMEYWNERCEPPWDFDQLEKKVLNAYQYGSNPVGSEHPAADFTDLGPEPGKRETPKAFFLDELVGEAPPRVWVVDQWLPAGEVTSLYGDGGQGKSLLALQLGVAVAYGVPWLGLTATKMPVLAVFAEDDRDEVHRRANAVRNHHDFASFTRQDGWFKVFAFPSEDYRLTDFDAQGRPSKDRGPFWKVLESLLKDMPPGPKLILLDTLADLFDGSENNRAQANYFVKTVLRGICVDYMATVGLLAHPSRAGMANEDLLSGSTAWNNSVRNRLTLTAHTILPDVRTLTRVKSNYAKTGEAINMKWQNGVFIPANEDDMFAEVANQNADHILEVLRVAVEMGSPYGLHGNHPRCIFKHLGNFANGTGPIPKKLLEKIVEDLIQRGFVENRMGQSRGNGLYPL